MSAKRGFTYDDRKQNLHNALEANKVVFFIMSKIMTSYFVYKLRVVEVKIGGSSKAQGNL